MSHAAHKVESPAFPLTDKQAVFLQRRAILLNKTLDSIEANNRELAALGIRVAPIPTLPVCKTLLKTITAVFLSGHAGHDASFNHVAKQLGVLPSRLEAVAA